MNDAIEAIRALQDVLGSYANLILAERRFEDAKGVARDLGVPEEAILEGARLVEKAAGQR